MCDTTSFIRQLIGEGTKKGDGAVTEGVWWVGEKRGGGIKESGVRLAEARGRESVKATRCRRKRLESDFPEVLELLLVGQESETWHRSGRLKRRSTGVRLIEGREVVVAETR